MSGENTKDEVFNSYKQSKKLFSEGGFNLRRYQTNSKGLPERINPQEIPEPDASPKQYEPTFSESTLGTSQSQKMEERKVLGVLWDPESDKFLFNVTDIARACWGMTILGN